jgi:hypothetical protein
MGNEQQVVRITAADVTAAIALAEPTPERTGSRQVTTLDFMEKEPSRLARVFTRGGAGAMSVTVDPSPVPGGAYLWSTQVRFPRIDLEAAFRRTGLEWPIWWAVGIGEMTNLIDKRSLRMLDFVGFATPELALPWFVRLSAAAAERDPLAPIVVRRTVRTPIDQEYDDVDDIEDLWIEAGRGLLSDAMKLEAYEAWQEREDEWRSAGGR